VTGSVRSLPARLGRRIRRDLGLLDDLGHDLALGISTFVPPYKAAPDPAARNARHEPTGYAALAIIRDRLKLDANDVFYDIGCGYGRALCYFARESIAQCIGIELAPDLAAVARANAQKLRGRRAKIEIRTGDATLQSYAGGTAFFMYNPFASEIMVSVLSRINLGRNGRTIRIIYVNPVARDAVNRREWLAIADEFQVPYLGSAMPVSVWRSR
jgi:SAM-dependent methyltransferase